MSFLWGHWYPCFLTSGDVCPGFQSQGGALVCTLSCLHAMDSPDSSLTFALTSMSALGPIYIQSLRRCWDITPKSIAHILLCTVTPGRSDVAATSLQRRSQMALQPIWQQCHKDVADADSSQSLDVNGPLNINIMLLKWTTILYVCFCVTIETTLNVDGEWKRHVWTYLRSTNNSPRVSWKRLHFQAILSQSF